MGICLKVIASSAELTQLSTDPALGFRGLAGLTNEDPLVDVRVAHSEAGTAPSSVAEVWRTGTLLAHEFAMQYQIQDMAQGNVPTQYWLAAMMFGPMPGNVMPPRSYLATPKNNKATFVAASFTIPAIDNTVQVTVLDASDFTIGDFTTINANEGVFCGGRFWDVVSIDSATTMTLRLKNVFGAVVTMLG